MTEPAPICVLDLEAGAPVPEAPTHARDGRAYGSAAVLVRVHGLPVGMLHVPLRDGRLDADEVADAAAERFGAVVAAHLAADGDRAVPACQADRERLRVHAPLVSVVIATRDGEATLGATLESLFAQELRPFEVIVVESACRGDGVRRLVEALAPTAPVPLRLVREPRPGLALAHNRGLEEAFGEVAAFTDDDVVADPLWLARLASGFAVGPDVACVTGLILPVELESPAQVWFDGYWGLGKGFERRTFDGRRDPQRPLHPFTAGAFGSGANMAFRTAALRALGGFDPALGTGSLAKGGDDLAAFFDVLAAGHRLVYEPTAVIRHRHRPDYLSLRRQAHGYGAGLTAYLAKTVVDDPRRLVTIAARSAKGLAYVLSPGSEKNAGRTADFPSELAWLERRGMAEGPFRYLVSRGRLRLEGAR